MRHRSNPRSAHVIGARVALYHFAFISSASLLFQSRGCIYSPIGDLWRRIDAPVLFILHQFDWSIRLDRAPIFSGFGFGEIASSLIVFFGTVIFSSAVYGLLTVVFVVLSRQLVSNQAQ